MDGRDARRHVRRAAAEHARRMAVDPGVLGDADDRSRVIEAWGWLAEFLAPGETSVLPANLRPLVRADGSPPDGAPAEWSAPDGDPGSIPAEPAPADRSA